MAKKRKKNRQPAMQTAYAAATGYPPYGYGYGYGMAAASDPAGVTPGINPYAHHLPPSGTLDASAFGLGATQPQGANGAGNPLDPAAAYLNAAGLNAGLLQGLPNALRSRQTEQFLLGLLIGGAAAWVLSDEELRNKLLKTGMKLYSGLMGGLEEFKEQMADVRAELDAEQQGGV